MIRATAYAKVNFFLEITGKRADGYHTLSTVFQTISLGDVLTFSPGPSLALSCSDPRLPVDETNLVMRAARALQAALKETRGAQIHLEKIVPTGAGLGGGSADAAATLRGLLKLWDRSIDSAELRKIAVGLGADVPFFLNGGLCSATGIGEILQPMKALPETWMVIVWPGFGISTKEAYAKVSLPLPIPQVHRHPDPRKCLYNRFESLIFSDCPALPQLKENLLKAGASAALMSGSGSAVYGLVSSKSVGEKVLAKCSGEYPHRWLVHTL